MLRRRYGLSYQATLPGLVLLCQTYLPVGFGLTMRDYRRLYCLVKGPSDENHIRTPSTYS